MERVTRDSNLTPQKAEKYESIREKVEKEFPPVTNRIQFEKIKAMTNEELNDALAENMGWTRGDKGYWDNKGDASDYKTFEWMPSTDHRHIAEVIDFMQQKSPFIKIMFAKNLAYCVTDNDQFLSRPHETGPLVFHTLFFMVSSSPRIKAEAALMTIDSRGLWKEDEMDLVDL